jgi:hypothetical protein
MLVSRTCGTSSFLLAEGMLVERPARPFDRAQGDSYCVDQQLVGGTAFPHERDRLRLGYFPHYARQVLLIQGGDAHGVLLRF